MDWTTRRSNLIFLALATGLIAIKLLFEFYPGTFPIRDQTEAFTWPLIAAIVAIGAVGVLAERSIGLPDAFADRARERRGAIIAMITGVLYGAVTIVQDLVASGATNPLATSEWLHVPWPWSIPFYAFGAVFLEFLLRLGALSILVWLIHVVVLRRRHFVPVFWVVNCLVALYEILPATLAHVANGNWIAVAATPLEPLYWSNVFEGWLLLRFGWFTPIVFRIAFYLVWHVVYGGLGPF